jgi:hypothetical protein
VNLAVSGDYGIGDPPRRARTRPLGGDYPLLLPVPARILVLVDGALVSRPIQIRVGGFLVNA